MRGRVLAPKLASLDSRSAIVVKSNQRDTGNKYRRNKHTNVYMKCNGCTFRCIQKMIMEIIYV